MHVMIWKSKSFSITFRPDRILMLASNKDSTLSNRNMWSYRALTTWKLRCHWFAVKLRESYTLRHRRKLLPFIPTAVAVVWRWWWCWWLLCTLNLSGISIEWLCLCSFARMYTFETRLHYMWFLAFAKIPYVSSCDKNRGIQNKLSSVMINAEHECVSFTYAYNFKKYPITHTKCVPNVWIVVLKRENGKAMPTNKNTHTNTEMKIEPGLSLNGNERKDWLRQLETKATFLNVGTRDTLVTLNYI